MLEIADEVRAALADGRPVVALESTIISHGMPYPDNVAMAQEVEHIVRDHGAVPATVAVLHGRPRVGLSADDLELLLHRADTALYRAKAQGRGQLVEGLSTAPLQDAPAGSASSSGGPDTPDAPDTRPGLDDQRPRQPT